MRVTVVELLDVGLTVDEVLVSELFTPRLDVREVGAVEADAVELALDVRVAFEVALLKAVTALTGLAEGRREDVAGFGDGGAGSTNILPFSFTCSSTIAARAMGRAESGELGTFIVCNSAPADVSERRLGLRPLGKLIEDAIEVRGD